jgi:lambda repressor-like predicted transcriptional regulator
MLPGTSRRVLFETPEKPLMDNLVAHKSVAQSLPPQEFWFDRYDGLARRLRETSGEKAIGFESPAGGTVRRRKAKDRTTVAAQASRDLIADFLDLGWSMRQIAVAAGISRSAVQQIYAGQSLRVTPKTERSLSRLAENTTTRSPGALVIDAEPSRKMIAELIEGGWSMRQIATVAQVSRSSVRSIQSGDSRRVHVKTERALRGVIETLYGIRSLQGPGRPADPRRSLMMSTAGGRRMANLSVVRARRPLDDRI